MEVKIGRICCRSVKAKLLSTPKLGGPELVCGSIRWTRRAILKETRFWKKSFYRSGLSSETAQPNQSKFCTDIFGTYGQVLGRSIPIGVPQGGPRGCPNLFERNFGGERGRIRGSSINANMLIALKLGGPELVSRLIRYTRRSILKETRLNKFFYRSGLSSETAQPNEFQFCTGVFCTCD